MNIIELFIKNIIILPNGCHEWVGCKSNNGLKSGKRRYYGNFNTGKINIGAHVFAYELHNHIESKFDVHHKCDFSLCVNGEHLEDITRSTHMKITHKFCSKGHDRTLTENVTKSGKCRPCQQEYNKRVRKNYPTYK